MKVTVSVAKGDAKLRQAYANVYKAGGQTVENLTELGKWYAFKQAPRDTGRTASMIKKQIYRGANGTEGKIIAQNPTLNPPKGYRWSMKKPFNLVRWMHTASRAQNYFHNGKDPRFMYSTWRYLNSIKKSVASGSFKKLKIGG